MSDALAKFRQKKPSGMLPSSKVGGDDSAGGNTRPVNDKETLPRWAKWVVGCNVIMVHCVVVMVGFTDIPFGLTDWALAVYVVTGLGLPVGLTRKVIGQALTDLFDLKSR